jgi:hypothetical protein
MPSVLSTSRISYKDMLLGAKPKSVVVEEPKEDEFEEMCPRISANDDSPYPYSLDYELELIEENYCGVFIKVETNHGYHMMPLCKCTMCTSEYNAFELEEKYSLLPPSKKGKKAGRR